MRDFEALQKRMRQSGCRVTQQRAVILRALCELDGHASVETIHEKVISYCSNARTGATPGWTADAAHAGKSVDLSTVYRTLERMCDLRILSRTDLGRGSTEYEVVTDRPHHHLVCRVCGQVTDLDHAYLAAAQDAIREDFDFDPVFDHFAIFGFCSRCRMPGDVREQPMVEDRRWACRIDSVPSIHAKPIIRSNHQEEEQR